jgi:hypothetical protein
MVHPDGCLDEMVPGGRPEALRGPHPADARPWAMTAWDASDGVRPDATVDAARPALADADAEKWVAPAQDGRAQGAKRWALPAAQASAAAPYKPAAVQSAEQSCAAAES